MVGIRAAACAVAALAALAVAGCGGDSSSAGLARLASPGSLVYVEAKLRPKGELKANVDSVARRLAGIEDLGDFVVAELESSTGEGGASLDFATEVEPWLGEEASAAFERLVDGDLSEPLIAVETTDPEAAQAFVEKRARESGEPSRSGDYEGVEFTVRAGDGSAIGTIGDALVLADGEKEFKAAVDSSQGDSLADEDRFQTAIEATSNAGVADVYVDIGGILEQSEDRIDPRARQALRGAGIDPSEATAVASVVPHSEQIEIDVSSDLGGRKAPAGNVSELLASMPADSVAAFAFSGFGEQLEEALDSLDEAGLPPDLGPGELKGALAGVGIDLDKIVRSLEDGAVFVEGEGRETLGGALVLSGKSSEAAEAISGLGTLLRSARIPGITAVTGEAAGFSIRSEELGDKPLVVVGNGKQVAVGYGLGPALKGLSAGSGARLGDTAGFKAASKALGATSISAYLDGPAALHLAEALVPRSESDFWSVRRYLKKVSYIGISTGNEGDLVTAKLIVGLGG